MKLFVEECLVVLLLLELKRIFKFQFSELNWAAGIFPDVFVAFFYSGLGCALALAGVVFLETILYTTDYWKKKLKQYDKIYRNEEGK